MDNHRDCCAKDADQLTNDYCVTSAKFEHFTAENAADHQAEDACSGDHRIVEDGFFFIPAELCSEYHVCVRIRSRGKGRLETAKCQTGSV